MECFLAHLAKMLKILKFMYFSSLSNFLRFIEEVKNRILLLHEMVYIIYQLQFLKYSETSLNKSIQDGKVIDHQKKKIFEHDWQPDKGLVFSTRPTKNMISIHEDWV